MRHASEAPAADLVRRAAEALTAKGFPTQPRAAEAGLADEAEASEERRRGELQRSMVRPAGAWCGFDGVSLPEVAQVSGARLRHTEEPLLARH